MDRSSKEKINKTTEILNDRTVRLNWYFQDITFKTQNKTRKHIQVHTEPSLGLPLSLGHKANLNKFKSIEIISSIFSGHNSMKLEINYRKRNEKKKLHGD